ncbi:MAG: ABC transporter substrate-binding protein [Chloroflexi bacterium]|nr:ABC transporter substrate-binding protein [Chloroflexota bacterium]
MTRSRLALFAVLLLLLASCGGAAVAPATSSATAAYPLTITDGRGKSVTIAARPQRIVSVAPSATEIIFAIGAQDRLVAVDDFSDFPSAAAALPKVGGTRTSPERIIAQRPDVIVAVTQGNLAPALEAQGQTVIVLDPPDIEAVYADIALLGRVFDRVGGARDVVAAMRTRVDAVAAKTKAVTERPRVLHEVDATDPTRIFVAGSNNFIDAMITVAGGTNAGAPSERKFPQLSSEQIVRSDPQIIVLGDARYGMTVEMVRARPGWQGIAAVRTSRVEIIDPDIVSRPGPRLVEGIEAYAKLIHPELFR